MEKGIINWKDAWKVLDDSKEYQVVDDEQVKCPICSDFTTPKTDGNGVKCGFIFDNISDDRPDFGGKQEPTSYTAEPQRLETINPLMPYASMNTDITFTGRLPFRQYQMVKLNRWSSLSPVERSLHVVFNKIELACTRNHVPSSVQYSAKCLFKRVHNLEKQKQGQKREGLRGPKRDGLIAACLYKAFKSLDLYWTKTRIAKVFEIEIGEVRRGISIFEELVKEQPELLDKVTNCKHYINWYSTGLKLSRRISTLCCKMFKKMSPFGVGNSKQPQSVAAGCLWVICQELEPSLSIDTLVNTTNISRATIREVLKIMGGIEKYCMICVFAADVCDQCEITNPLTRNKIQRVCKVLYNLLNAFPILENKLWRLGCFAVYFVLTWNDIPFNEQKFVNDCAINYSDLEMSTLGTYNPFICTNLVPGYTSTISSNSPITLSSQSNQSQYIIGSVAQSIMLPRVNNPTLANGYHVTISNKSTAASNVYAAGPINAVSVASYTFPLTTITVTNIVGTFPAGGGTFQILTTSGLQSIVYTSFAAGVFTFASAGSGTAPIGSVVSTVISTVLSVIPSSEHYISCNDNLAGNTNGNVNGWYVSPLVSGLVMDNLATSVKYPTAPQTEGMWYGPGTKINTASGAVNIGVNSIAAASAIALGDSAVSSGTSSVAIGSGSTATGASTLAILGNTGTSAALRCISMLGAGNTTKTGTDNLLIGRNVGSILTTGQINILVGDNTGQYLTTGSNNIALGINVLQNAGTNSNSTAVGHLALSRMSETAYATGTASQSALAVTGTSTLWNSAMTSGSWIQYASGGASMPVRITSTNSATSITAEAAVTIAATPYTLTYGTTYAVNTASQSGTTVTGVSTTFTSSMVGGTLTYFGQTYSSGSVSQTGTTITGSGFTGSMAPGYIVYFTSFTINPMTFASQTGNTVTATAASFSPADVGTYIIFTGGNEIAYITQYVNSTTVNVATSRTIGSTNFIMTGPQISASLVTAFVNATTLTTAAVSSQTIPVFTQFILFYNNGAAPTRITQFNSATSLTVETSQTIAATNYMIQYSNFNDRINTVYGYASGENVRDGTNNVLIGVSAGSDVYNGNSNVIVGTANSNPVIDSNNITYGTENVNAGGIAVGRSNTVAASSNIAIGASSQANSTNTIAIGNGSIASVANSIVLGQSATVAGASAALGLALNSASVVSGTLGLTVNNVSYQMPMYKSYYQSVTLTGAGTTTLSYSGTNSAKMTYFTGNFTQNIVLPPATSGALGYELKIVNVSSGNLSIYADAGLTSLVTTLVAPSMGVSRGGWGYFTCIDTSANVAASWSAELGTTDL